MRESAMRLKELARSISDGDSIDWETWEREPGDIQEEALVRSLHRIAGIADACRSLRSGDDGNRVGSAARWGLGSGMVGRGLERVFRRSASAGCSWLLRRASGTPVASSEAISTVKHPNVATIYGADERDGSVGIWMEFLEGPTVESKLRERGPFTATETVRIGADVCRALAAVHSVNVLHRDVKAENIILQGGTRAVLTDFGVGVEFTEPAGGKSHDVCGTPLYLAPEVLRGSPQTVASDIYSGGVLLYHLVTGDFHVVARDAEELAEAHREGSLRLLKDASPGLPEAFVRVVDRALAPTPGERFDTAGEMADALDALVRKLEPRRRKPRARELVLGASLVVATLAALNHFFSPFAEVSPGSQILMASIENRTGDHRLNAVQTLLETELHQSSHLQLVEEARIGSALTRMVQKSVRKPISRLLGKWPGVSEHHWFSLERSCLLARVIAFPFSWTFSGRALPVRP
jgi:serine/threonine protein kinase